MDPACSTCGAALVLLIGVRQCPACLLLAGLAAPPRTQADESLGQVGPYVLRSRLGEGGMGEIFLAEQRTPLRRVVALKLLKARLDDRALAARFDAEREALTILDHQGIARVLDAGVTDDHRPFLAMEYVDGEWLTTFCDHHRLDVARRLNLCADVCVAVHHAHQKGVIHRDLKPSNVLAFWQGDRAVAKVIDFGIAKLVGDGGRDRSGTAHGVVLGTPAYMSPEQAALRPDQVDARTDIYALGLLLYELLTGAVPFAAATADGASLAETLRAVREDDPPRLVHRLDQLGAAASRVAMQRGVDANALRRTLRGDLEWIVARALEKNPTRRYQSASELASDIRRYLASEPVQAAPPSLRYRLAKAMNRHRAVAAGFAVALAATAVGTVAAATQWARAVEARSDARRQLVTSLVAAGMDRVAADDGAAAMVWLARALELEDDPARIEAHRRRIGHAAAALPRIVRLWAHSAGTSLLAQSDSGRVAAGAWNGSIRIWDLTSGEVVADLSRPGEITALQLRRDGTQLAAATGEGSALSWRLGSERPEIEVQHGVGHTAAVYSPDERALATGGADGAVRIWNLSTRQLLHTFDVGGPVGRIVFSRDGRHLAVGVLGLGFRIVTLERPHGAGRLIACSLTSENDAGAFLANAAFVAPCGNVIRLWTASGDTVASSSVTVAQPADLIVSSPDGRRLLASGDANATLIDPTSAPWTSQGLPTRSIAAVARFDETGDRIVVCSTGGDVHVWTRSGERVTPLLPHNGACADARFLHDGRFLVTASTDGLVRVWELPPRRTPVVELPGFVDQIVFSPNARRIATGYGAFSPARGQVRVWDRISGAPVTPPLDAPGRPWSVRFVPDGSRVAVGTAALDVPSTTRVWDARTGEPTTPPRGDGQVHHQAVSPDGVYVAAALDRSAAGQPGLVVVRRTSDGAERYPALVVPGAPTAVDIDREGRRLLAAGLDSRVSLQIWDLLTGAKLATAAHPGGARGAFFLHDGRVFSVGGDQRGRLWSQALASQSTTIVYPGSPATASLSPDGSRVVVSTESGDVHVHLLARPEAPLAVLHHQGLVYASSFSPDGRWLATAGFDRTTRVWEASTGVPITPVHRTPALVWHAMFAPSGDAWGYSGAGAFLEPLRIDRRPPDVVATWAEVHGGRSLGAAGEEVPLAPELVAARWRRLSTNSAPITPPSDEWLRGRAREAVGAGRWTGARQGLEELQRRGALRWPDTVRLLTVYAASGAWPSVRALAQRIDVPVSAAPELARMQAIASVHLRDRAGVAMLCRQLVRDVAPSGNPERAATAVRVCLLARHAPDLPWPEIVALARRTPAVSMDGVSRDVLLAVTLLAAGDRRAAERELARAAPPGERLPLRTLAYLEEASARTDQRVERARHAAAIDAVVSERVSQGGRSQATAIPGRSRKSSLSACARSEGAESTEGCAGRQRFAGMTAAYLHLLERELHAPCGRADPRDWIPAEVVEV